MPVNDTTTNRGYQLPHATNNLDYDVARLRASFTAIDADVASLLTSVAGKAASSHTHVISDVSGLQSALDAKMAANASIPFDFLSDVSVASAVANQFLRRSGTDWIPVTLDGSMIEAGTVPIARLPAHLATPALNAAYAALVHGHAIGDVTGLQAALDTKVNISSLFGFRNRLINARPWFDQRNLAASVTVGPNLEGKFFADKWWIVSGRSGGSGGVFTGQLQSSGGLSWARITITGARPTLSNEDYYFHHTIELANYFDFMWGNADARPATLSFWCRSSVAGLHSGSIKNSNATLTFPFSFTINNPNTWEYKTVSVLPPTTGSFASHIYVFFSLGGTTKGTAGSWLSGNFSGAVGSVNLISTSGATFDIRDVQFERENIATPFENRPVGLEVSLAQRYFFRKDALTYFNGNSGNSTVARGSAQFAVPMRAAPTVVIYPYQNLVGGPGAAYVSNTNSTTSINLIEGITSDGFNTIGNSANLPSSSYLYGFSFTAEAEIY